jgi:1-deoxy-D-xylulose-5-phosphate synthase
VLVHAITEKGRGYQPARDDVADQFHAVGRIDPKTGGALSPSTSRAWTDVFADALVDVGERHPQVIAMTAAMLRPTGLAPFAERFPSRVYDVGIAEQHAVASSAGLAYGGLHPVVAIYATFMNRAFDQVLMDVALHKAGVTFGRSQPPRHLGSRDAATRTRHPHRGAPRR